jgi:xanthine dehydrogenase small subunit
VLIALGATITLRKGNLRRTMAVEDFFVAYGKQDRAPGEFLESIAVPRPAANAIHAAYKISKRRDEDISSVCAAFNVTVEDGVITAARLAFGGMAGTPKRASHAEAVLVGAVWSEATLLAAAARLGDDFAPLTDWRASAEYRLQVSKNLFRRFWLEQQAGAADVRLSA